MVGHQIVANWFHVLRDGVMSAEASFQGSVRRAADSSLLSLAAKLAAVVLLPLGGFIGAAIWNKLDKTSESTARLEEQFKGLVERQIPDLKIGFNSRFDAQADRITAHDYRINRLEDWRNMRGTP